MNTATEPTVLAENISNDTLAAILVNGILANPSGGTIWLHGAVPKNAYIVGGLHCHITPLPDGVGAADRTQAEEGARAFVSGLLPHVLILSDCIGWWVDNGDLYIDASTAPSNLHRAAEAAYYRHQLAIGHWANYEYKASIPMDL